MSFSGKWRVTEMDAWDREAFDLLGPAFFSFDGRRSGNLRFIAVEGRMDCRHGKRDGRPFVEFTWDGNDECDAASGRGWGRVEKDGSLVGQIFICHGDDSGFKAVRAREEAKPRRNEASSTKAKRGGR